MPDEWNPPVELSPDEEKLLKLCKKQKLWGFLRLYRHQLLDEEVRTALDSMYAAGPKGRPRIPPEQLALALVLQVAVGAADHEVPTLTAADRRWQMVLDLDDSLAQAFSQGTVFEFRERVRKSGLMQVLLDKTVDLARSTKGFSDKRLRALFDSSPLVGAGRVEDTFNLLGRAIGQLLGTAAEEGLFDATRVAADLQVTVFGGSSVKGALDIDWRKPEARNAALAALLDQFERLRDWLEEYFGEDKLHQPPLAERIGIVEKIIEQDTEPDPDSPTPSSARKIRQGVAADRLVSLSDQDMRHGRKSKTKAFCGYKRHIAVDMDVQGLICATKVEPANKREYEGAQPLMEELDGKELSLVELGADRGYIPAEAVTSARERSVDVISKPPTPKKSPYFSKEDFEFDFDEATVTCPAGVVRPLKRPNVNFPTAKCRDCRLRPACTSSTRRSLTIHPQEQWYRQMANELKTPAGRARRRERIPVEHALARVSSIQGNRARFRGLAKNDFDLQRASVVNNCYVLAALFSKAA